MGRKIKLIKTERYKILPKSWNEPGLRQYTNRWKKTNKIIFTGDQGQGLSVIVKTYVDTGKLKREYKNIHICCLCCLDKKEKDQLSFYLPGKPYKRKLSKGEWKDDLLELGGTVSSMSIWKKILLPILGVELKEGIKL